MKELGRLVDFSAWNGKDFYAVVLPSEELVKEILNLKKISSLSSRNVKV